MTSTTAQRAAEGQQVCDASALEAHLAAVERRCEALASEIAATRSRLSEVPAIQTAQERCVELGEIVLAAMERAAEERARHQDVCDELRRSTDGAIEDLRRDTQARVAQLASALASLESLEPEEPPAAHRVGHLSVVD